MIGVVGTVAAAGGAMYSANQQNKASKNIAGSMNNLPTAPNYQGAWDEGFYKQFQATPWLANQEFELRQQYGPAYAKLAADMYAKNLPTYANANMATLRKIDPESIKGRKQLYGNVSGDLALGHSLRPEYLAEIQNDVRGAQTARGNYRGNAPISAEASVTAGQREQMYQQRLGNMMNFLRGPTPQDHFGKLAGAGSGALAAGSAGMASPGWAFVEQPRGFANDFVRNAQLEFNGNTGRESAIGSAQAAAPPQESPYMAAIMAALGSGTNMAMAYGANKGGSSLAGTGSYVPAQTGSWMTNASGGIR